MGYGNCAWEMEEKSKKEWETGENNFRNSPPPHPPRPYPHPHPTPSSSSPSAQAEAVGCGLRAGMRSNWAWAEPEVAFSLGVIAAASSALSLVPQPPLLKNHLQRQRSRRRSCRAQDSGGIGSGTFHVIFCSEPLLASPRRLSHRKSQRSWGRGRAACCTERNRTRARDVRYQTGGLPPLSQLVICFGAEWNSRALFKPHRLWRRGIPAVPVEGIPTPERIWVGPDRRVHHRVRGGSHWECPGWVSSRAALQRAVKSPPPLAAKAQKTPPSPWDANKEVAALGVGFPIKKRKKSFLIFGTRTQPLEW